jgi:hypothetical protein
MRSRSVPPGASGSNLVARAAAIASAALFSLVLASCLGVLGLDGYQAAPEALCSLLERCYGGPEEITQCRGHVASQLAAAGPERGEWLARFTDSGCLASCSNARACLDQPPICRGSRESCTNFQQCCGFTELKATCVRESCCKLPSSACTQDVDCCEGKCLGNPPTCGGTQCANENTPCDFDADGEDDDCCSKVCNPDTHLCATACSPEGFQCKADFECCYKNCKDGLCAPCKPDGERCLRDTDCCTGTCDPTVGICGPSACRADGFFCTDDSHCCSGFCSHYGECSMPGECNEEGEECIRDDECCTLQCSFFDSVCGCAKDGKKCNQSFECCSGSCVHGKCGQCHEPGWDCDKPGDCCSGLCKEGQCCGDPGCVHDICTEGPGLSPTGCLANGLVQAECVALICEADPRCCCDGWTQADCVSKVAEVCNLECP